MKPAGAACVSCPARDAKCVLPEPSRNGKPRLAIVGEAPGRGELEQGRPFVGGNGRLLARGLRTMGLDRGDVHWTNAVLCDCSPDDFAKARRACAERLRAELKEAAAPIVVPVGTMGLHSALALTKKPQILQWRGSITRDRGMFVMPTIHPTFVMRAPKWGPVLERDFARVQRVLNSGWTDPFDMPGRRYEVVRTIADLRAGIASLAGDDLGFDVETVGLGPTRTALVCFALSDGDLTIVVPWSRAQNGIEPWWISPATAAGIVSRRLAKAVAVTHNGPVFDHIVAARYALRIGKWDDTLLGAHSHASHLPKNLAHVATQYLDIPPWKQWDHAADLEKLWGYNARDTLYTILTRREQRKEIGI